MGIILVTGGVQFRMKKILIADDEARMRKLVGDFLKRAGYEIAEAENGREALNLFFADSGIDMIILDVMMPEMDGWTVCRKIRENSHVPIIMLTARGEESDELFGFDLGADEYVTKPFSPKVLVARVQALFRRLEKSDLDQNVIRNYDGIELDEGAHMVRLNSNNLDLSPKEYELLLYLVNNRGKALSRDQILNNVWGYDFFGDTRTVDTHIKKLRLKLQEKGDLIQTVWGLGYRFEGGK